MMSMENGNGRKFEDADIGIDGNYYGATATYNKN